MIRMLLLAVNVSRSTLVHKGCVNLVRGLSCSRQPEFKVSKFGELKVKSGSTCNFAVQPANPNLFPDQDIAFFEFTGDGFQSGELNIVCSALDKTSLLTVTKSDRSFGEKELRVCQASVPVKYDVDAEVKKDRSLSVVNMQNDYVTVKSEHGLCLLKNIQTRAASVSTKGGSIVSEGLLQGDVIMETKLQGHIQIFKPLCNNLTIKTEGGNISIASLYADQSKLSTQTGDISIHSAHRSVDVSIAKHGNLSINSLDGDLVAVVNSGNVSVYACRHQSISINVERGDITVKVPAELTACRLDLSADSVAIDSRLDISSLQREELNGTVHFSGSVMKAPKSQRGPVAGSTISAHSRCGQVNLVCQDFFSSLNLSKFTDYDDDDD